MTKMFSKCPEVSGTDEISLFIKLGKKLVDMNFARRMNRITNGNTLELSLKSLFVDTETDTYEATNKTFVESLVKYCFDRANTGYDWNGLETVKNPMVRNTAFKETFNAVIAQILTPVIPAVVSAQYMEIAEIQNIGWGETGRFIIKPNEMFLVNEIAEGVQFGALQRLYNDEVTVNPTPKQVRYDLDWYQVAAGIFDFGEFSYKIGASFGAYIQSQVITSFTSVITSGISAGSAYFASGFSDTHYLTVGQAVKAANANSEVYVFGTLVALGLVFPSTVGLQYGLGEEWAKTGFLDKYKGFRLIEMAQSLVPGTINTTATFMIPNDVLYFIPMNWYKPIKVVFEGSTISVETDPTRTVDKTGGLTITSRFGVASAVGSKFGALINVTA